MDRIDLAKSLFGARSDADSPNTSTLSALPVNNTTMTRAFAVADSEAGYVAVDIDGVRVSVPTTFAVREGDECLVSITAHDPVVAGVVGRGDEVDEAVRAADGKAGAAAEAAENSARAAADAHAAALEAADAASDAQAGAEAAMAAVDGVSGEIAAVREDVDLLDEGLASAKEGLAAVERDMRANYAKSTDLAQVRSDMESSVRQSAAEIRAEVSETYALQTDMADAREKVEKAQESASAAVTAAERANEAAGAATAAAAEAKTQAVAAAEAYADDIAETLQGQIDGAIETWSGAVAPTASNAPASAWADAATRKKHVGDLYYDTVTGYAYRYGTNLAWTLIKDTDVTKAVQGAAEAQAAADAAKADAEAAKGTASRAEEAASKAQSDVDGLETRVGTAETAIRQNASAITLRATKTEARGYADAALDSAKEYSDARLEVQADRITATVSETGILKARVTTVEQTASGLSVSLGNTDKAVSAAQSAASAAKSSAAAAQVTADTARAEAAGAAKTATNYMEYTGSGLDVGNKSSGKWAGFRARMTSSAFQVLGSTGTVLASYGAKLVELGKGAADAVVSLCGGKGVLKYESVVKELSGAAEPTLSLWGDNVSVRSGYSGLADLPASASGSFSASLKVVDGADRGSQGKELSTSGVEATSGRVAVHAGHSSDWGSAESSEMVFAPGSIDAYAKYSQAFRTSHGSLAVGSSIEADLPVRLNCTGDAAGTAAGNPALTIGTTSGLHIAIDSNEIMAKKTATTTGQLNLNLDGGAVTVRGNPVYGAKVLYSNASGSNGTVTLSETAASFTFLDIYYRNDDVRWDCLRVYSPNGKIVAFTSSGANADQLWVKTAARTISGKTISTVANTYMNGNAVWYSEYTKSNFIYIGYVVGYK